MTSNHLSYNLNNSHPIIKRPSRSELFKTTKTSESLYITYENIPLLRNNINNRPNDFFSLNVPLTSKIPKFTSISISNFLLPPSNNIFNISQNYYNTYFIVGMQSVNNVAEELIVSVNLVDGVYTNDNICNALESLLNQSVTQTLKSRDENSLDYNKFNVLYSSVTRKFSITNDVDTFYVDVPGTILKEQSVGYCSTTTPLALPNILGFSFQTSNFIDSVNVIEGVYPSILQNKSSIVVKSKNFTPGDKVSNDPLNHLQYFGVLYLTNTDSVNTEENSGSVTPEYVVPDTESLSNLDFVFLDNFGYSFPIMMYEFSITFKISL